MSLSRFQDSFFKSKQGSIQYELKKVIPNLTLTGNTLEVGCGRRAWLSLLIKQRFKCFLVTSDVEADKVRTAKKVASEIGLESDHYVVFDIAHIPFNDWTFNNVVGNAVMHHVLPSLNLVVSEFQRVLVESGQVLFTGEIVASRFLGWVWKMVKLRQYPDEGITTMKNWRKAFLSGGLSSVSVTRENRYGCSGSRLRNIYYFFCQFIPNCLIVRYGLTSCTLSATCKGNQNIDTI